MRGTMLCALLETIGTLGILFSLAVKLGKPSVGVTACGKNTGGAPESSGPDQRW